MDNYGIITLLPPILIIAFALITKKTFEALVLGGLVGCVIAYGTGFFGGYLDFLYETMSDTGNIWVILTQKPLPDLQHWFSNIPTQRKSP